MWCVPVVGELSILTAAEVKGVLVDALGRGEDLELDLSEVTEMDTAGLQLLLMLRREAGQLSRSVSLVAPSEAVRSVLAIARLDDRLDAVAGAGTLAGAVSRP